ADGRRVPEALEKPRSAPALEPAGKRFGDDEIPTQHRHREEDDEQTLADYIRLREEMRKADLRFHSSLPIGKKSGRAPTRQLLARRAARARTSSVAPLCEPPRRAARARWTYGFPLPVRCPLR